MSEPHTLIEEVISFFRAEDLPWTDVAKTDSPQGVRFLHRELTWGSGRYQRMRLRVGDCKDWGCVDVYLWDTELRTEKGNRCRDCWRHRASVFPGGDEGWSSSFWFEARLAEARAALHLPSPPHSQLVGMSLIHRSVAGEFLTLHQAWDTDFRAARAGNCFLEWGENFQAYFTHWGDGWSIRWRDEGEISIVRHKPELRKSQDFAEFVKRFRKEKP